MRLMKEEEYWSSVYGDKLYIFYSLPINDLNIGLSGITCTMIKSI